MTGSKNWLNGSRWIVGVLLVILMMAAQSATSQTRQEGYYYPSITSTEAFSRALGPRQATREERIALTATIEKVLLGATTTPRIAVFAKGAAAEKLIIVALDDEIFRTLFRARAQMAVLTSNLRVTSFAQNAGLGAEITFYDLVYMLNFDTLTLTDGVTWSHQVTFE